MRYYFFMVCIFFVNTLTAASPKPQASIQRIIETREGKKSCWGVVIRLKELSFKKSISGHELSIIEAKHSREVKDIMTWSVDASRKKLTIKFKKGCGDFGSGNMVEITIKPSALAGTNKEKIQLSIPTDIP
jgi:hypothetical protein